MNAYEKKQAILVTEFDRYVMEHPDFALQIPHGAQIVIQVEGDEPFNEALRGNEWVNLPLLSPDNVEGS